MTRHFSDYSILAILCAIYLVTIYRFQTTSKFVLLATASFATIYLIWGIAHHLRSKNFHARIVLEYLLVALLGVAIVSTLLI
jgi:hypothetical protein